MKHVGAAAAWAEYRNAELARLQPVLRELGYELEEEQVHLGGERYLTAGRKLVLVGRRSSDGMRVIIKASSDRDGVAEIERELAYRGVLEQLNFAYHVFLSPPVLLDEQRGALRLLVTEFIEQSSTFLARPLEEQFFLALKAFEGLEGVHATTYGHRRDVRSTLGMWSSGTYLAELGSRRRELGGLGGDQLVAASLDVACRALEESRDVVDRYSGFLTHWDLVPHNLRVSGHGIYLLDHSALRFGCRYEGWARFINFMALYNPPLEVALVRYVAENRGPDHSRALRAMRLYRLAELALYYRRTLHEAEGSLGQLNQLRVSFWVAVQRAIVDGQQVNPTTVGTYRAERDALRAEDERIRQAELH